jgi:hypothetical protein
MYIRTKTFQIIIFFVVLYAFAATAVFAATVLSREGENYDSIYNVRRNSIYIDQKQNASGLKALHFSYKGDTAYYTINLPEAVSHGTLKMRYSDDVAYNYVAVYLDGELKGSFKTADTGTWESFKWHPSEITLGRIEPGVHEISFMQSTDGNYGFTLDVFTINDSANWLLNMVEMPWHENEADYSSTGAASVQMVLDYIQQGANVPLISQNEIYEFAKGARPYGPDLTPDEIDLVLGYFDPYDMLISNSYDVYDALSGGNPYQGYNFTVNTYDPVSNPEAMNEYMRDICHWMAYDVSEEEWWKEPRVLVARPNTPAVVPLFGDTQGYQHWVAVKGCVTSAHPCPEPGTDPWKTPDFTVYGFWIKDPLVLGLGQDVYVTAAECALTYFRPLATKDIYDGLYVHIAEPSELLDGGSAEIKKPLRDISNLAFIGIDVEMQTDLKGSTRIGGSNVSQQFTSRVKKRSWRDLVDTYFLRDEEAVKIFDSARMRKPIKIKRLDRDDADYYLIPFDRVDTHKGFLTTAVIILDAKNGYFKEASWTLNPEKLIPVSKVDALRCIRHYIMRQMCVDIRKEKKKENRVIIQAKYQLFLQSIQRRDVVSELVWEPQGVSGTPYKPYWHVDVNGYEWYVTQDKKVIPLFDFLNALKDSESNVFQINKVLNDMRPKR